MKYTIPLNAVPGKTVLNIADPVITVDPLVIPNLPPIVIVTAPGSITLPSVLTLTATASDPEGGVLTYLWGKVSGGTATITNQDKAIATVNGMVAGNYVFKVDVTDNKGAKVSANTPTIAVKVITPPPTLIARAGVDAVLTAPNNYLILDGMASTGTNAITTYLWSYISGPSGYNIDNPNSARSGFSNLVQGVYVFRLTITDSTGAKATDDVSVTVKAGAIIPPVEPPIPPPSGTGYLSLPISTATTYNGVNNIVITGRQFSNINNAVNQNGNILRFFGCNGVTITKCFFGEASGGDHGGDRAIYFDHCSNIRVEENLFFDQGGSILVSSHGDGMIIRNNEGINVRGPYPKGNFIQLNSCNGSGYIIEQFRGENFYGESYPEDLISNYASSGTAASPILVQDNLFRGGGSSTTGGGSLAGDHGGSNITIQRNKFMNVGQYILAVVGGNNNKILDNWGWQDQKPWSANGIVAYSYSPPCTNVLIQRNMVHAVCGLAIRCTPGAINNTYFPNECTFIGDPKAGVTDFTDVTLMKFPAKLITFITEDEIWRLRHYTKKHEALIVATAQAAPQFYSAQSISRPTASATFSLAQGIYTLRSTSTASSGNSISSVRWVQVSGNPVTIALPNAAVTTISGLVAGQYIFRLEVTQMNNLSLNVFTQDAVWITINN